MSLKLAAIALGTVVFYFIFRKKEDTFCFIHDGVEKCFQRPLKYNDAVTIYDIGLDATRLQDRDMFAGLLRIDGYPAFADDILRGT